MQERKNDMIEINSFLASSLINKQFPQWAQLPIRPVEKGGYDNYTFHLGDDMSIRIPRDEEHAPQVEKEAFWLPKLAKQLSLPIPMPIAKGKPDENYPFHWSINKWIEGDTLTHNNISNLNDLALDLSGFLKELQSLETLNGPLGGEHNYYRGCPLNHYKFHEWTLTALDLLADVINRDKCLAIWNRAISTKWSKDPVWIHGDVAPGNLLVANGRLSAVIDFGVMAVGDPAADLVMAWTFFDEKSREKFLNSLAMDKDTIDRARGWALWKALVTWMWEDKASEAVMQAKKVIKVLMNE